MKLQGKYHMPYVVAVPPSLPTGPLPRLGSKAGLEMLGLDVTRSWVLACAGDNPGASSKAAARTVATLAAVKRDFMAEPFKNMMWITKSWLVHKHMSPTAAPIAPRHPAPLSFWTVFSTGTFEAATQSRRFAAPL